MHLGEVVRQIRDADPWPLALGVVLASATFPLRLIRWRLLLRDESGRPLKPWPLWHAIAIGFMANNLLPFRAGELVRVFAATKLSGARFTAALSSIAVERIFDGLAVIALLAAGLLTSDLPSGVGGRRRLDSRDAAQVAGLLSLGALVMAAAHRRLSGTRPSAWFAGSFHAGRFTERVIAMIEGIRHGLASLRSPSLLVGVIVWSLALWLLHALALWVSFAAFDIPVGFGGALVLQGVLVIGVSVQLTPGFVGQFEASVVAALALYGISNDVASSYAIAYHGATFVPITLAGAWSLARTPGGAQRPAGRSGIVTDTAVRLPAHAKLNLFLRVLAREADGYHGLETVFCLVDLADELRAERREARGVTIEVQGADVGPAADNLAVRAAAAVLAATGDRFGVHLTLTKRIPVRAGLGGGSSDAAAALLAVNRLAGGAIPRHELLQFAAKLGSDVPFFVAGAPLALAWSHGDRLMRLPALPSAPALLLVPDRLDLHRGGLCLGGRGSADGRPARRGRARPGRALHLGRHRPDGRQRLRVGRSSAAIRRSAPHSRRWPAPGRWSAG